MLTKMMITALIVKHGMLNMIQIHFADLTSKAVFIVNDSEGNYFRINGAILFPSIENLFRTLNGEPIISKESSKILNDMIISKKLIETFDNFDNIDDKFPEYFI